jgi:hypothetical protein
MCQILMADSLNLGKTHKPARIAVIRTDAVKKKTTLLQFRVRNVIEEQLKNNQIVAEEMLLWGYRGNPADHEYLDYLTAKSLLLNAHGVSNLTLQEQEHWLSGELNATQSLRGEFDALAVKRAGHLVEAHERFRAVVGGKKYHAVEPVLPMDIMGLYILLPKIGE